MGIDKVAVSSSLFDACTDADGLTDEDLKQIGEEHGLSDLQLEGLKGIVRDGYIDSSDKKFLIGEGKWAIKSGDQHQRDVFNATFGIFKGSKRAVNTLSGIDGLALTRTRLSSIQSMLDTSTSSRELADLTLGLLSLYRDEALSLGITPQMLNGTEEYCFEISDDGVECATQPEHFPEVWEKSPQGRKQALLINEFPEIARQLMTLLETRESPSLDLNIIEFIEFIADRANSVSMSGHPATEMLKAELWLMKNPLLTGLSYVYEHLEGISNPSADPLYVEARTDELLDCLDQL